MNKDTISAHQVGVISAIILFTLKMTALPSLLYKYNGTGAIISIFVVIVLNGLFLWLLVWAKYKYPNCKMYDIFKNKIGTTLTKILYTIFFVFFFLKLLLMLSDGYTFIKDVADEEFSILKMFLCFLPVISALAYSGLRNLGRTGEFFLPFIIICLVLAISFSIIPINSWSFGSLTIYGFKGFFDSLFRLSFWTGDLFALIIFFDKMEIKKGKVKEVFVPFIFMAVLLFVIYVLYFALYQETSIFHVNLLNDVVQYAIGTAKGWHMDFFAIIVFMINLYLQSAIILYCANDCLGRVFNFKKPELSMFIINLFIIIVEFLYLNDYLAYVLFAENVLCYFSAITIVVVPILLLVITLTKKGKINENV